MALRTALYDTHLRQGAKIIDFGGWDMPLHYGSQIEEHHAVRRDAGMFDVSHMGVVDLEGAQAREFLRHLLANDVGRLTIPGKALYSCMLLPGGGVLDDLIVYFVGEGKYRLVVNASTRDKDLEWIRRHARAFDVGVAERPDLAMIAIQGPQARARTVAALAAAGFPAADCDAALALAPFQGGAFGAPPALAPLHGAGSGAAPVLAPFQGGAFGAWFIARTGYTGEDGFEVMLPTAAAAEFWQALHAQGVHAAGLGARDTLRLEAGMALYGNDMDESHHPLESGLAWTVAFDPAARDFIGRAALEELRRTPHPRQVGLVLDERGVLRSHQRIEPAGEVTSGTFSPTLHRSIALARVPPTAVSPVQVEIRGKLHEAHIVKPPFVRHGRSLI